MTVQSVCAIAMRLCRPPPVKHASHPHCLSRLATHRQRSTQGCDNVDCFCERSPTSPIRDCRWEHSHQQLYTPLCTRCTSMWFIRRPIRRTGRIGTHSLCWSFLASSAFASTSEQPWGRQPQAHRTRRPCQPGAFVWPAVQGVQWNGPPVAGMASTEASTGRSLGDQRKTQGDHVGPKGDPGAPPSAGTSSQTSPGGMRVNLEHFRGRAPLNFGLVPL